MSLTDNPGGTAATTDAGTDAGTLDAPPPSPTDATTAPPAPGDTATSPVPVDTAQPAAKAPTAPSATATGSDATSDATGADTAAPASFPVGELVGRRNPDSGELEAVGIVVEEVPIEINPQTQETKTAYRVAWLPLDLGAGLIFADGHEAIR